MNDLIFRTMKETFPYGWKDFSSDVAILSVVLGILLLLVGSFQDFFDKFHALFN
tara:strand:- start:640 stop:801 length:162 start_codon:yes stop_codon:yes gene_type:complete